MGYHASGDGYVVLKKSALTTKGMSALCRRAFGKDAKLEDYIGTDKADLSALRRLIMKIDDDYGYVPGEGFIEMSCKLKGHPEFELTHNDENYHGEILRDFLDIFTPFVVEGNIALSGDDNLHWQFDFRKGWQEDTGEIHYATGEPLSVQQTPKGILATKDGESITFTKKELAKLLQGSGLNKDKDVNAGIATLMKNYSKCIVCDAETCMMNPHGICLAPLLTGKKPVITDDEGCKDYVPADESMFL